MSIKSWLTQPIVLLSLLLSAIWAVVDANERLLHTNKQTNQAASQASTVQLASRVLTESQQQFITEQYQRFIIEDESETPTIEQLSEQEQLNQQGILQNVFINDYKLTLKAVITEQNDASASATVLAYALINKTHIPSGKTELVKVLNEELIEGFTLTVLSSTQVQLVRSHAKGEQQITLTMYRVAANTKQ